jgi:hypothetical protein
MEIRRKEENIRIKIRLTKDLSIRK